MPRAGDPPLLLFPKKLGNAWNNNSLAGPREREGRKKCDGGVETEAIFPIFATVGNTRVGSPFIGAVCLAWDLPKYQSPLANNIVYIRMYIHISHSDVYDATIFLWSFLSSSSSCLFRDNSSLIPKFLYDSMDRTLRSIDGNKYFSNRIFPFPFGYCYERYPSSGGGGPLILVDPIFHRVLYF